MSDNQVYDPYTQQCFSVNGAPATDACPSIDTFSQNLSQSTLAAVAAQYSGAVDATGTPLPYDASRDGPAAGVAAQVINEFVDDMTTDQTVRVDDGSGGFKDVQMPRQFTQEDMCSMTLGIAQLSGDSRSRDTDLCPPASAGYDIHLDSMGWCNGPTAGGYSDPGMPGHNILPMVNPQTLEVVPVSLGTPGGNQCTDAGSAASSESQQRRACAFAGEIHQDTTDDNGKSLSFANMNTWLKNN